MGLGSLWRNSSGTVAQVLDCLSLTAVRLVVVAVAAVAAVVASADFGAVLVDCH